MKDKNQDIEVEFDAAGNLTGFIVAGLTAGQDTVSSFMGCSSTSPCQSWEGYILKMKPNLAQEVWRNQFTSFTGGVGKYTNLPQYGGAAVYTECFSLAKIPGRNSRTTQLHIISERLAFGP